MELASNIPASSSSVAESSLEKNLAARPKSCGQCHEPVFKYTCPACSIRTCSLVCSNQHKIERRCSGKRNRVKYVPLNQYSWGQLMQDYSYLEEIHRLVSGSRDSQSSKSVFTPTSLHNQSNNNPSGKKSFLARKAALEGVELLLMAEGMARRKINMTNYNKKKNCIQWTLEMIFPGDEKKTDNGAEASDPSSRRFSQLIHQVASDTKISEVLKQTLNIKKLKLPQERKSALLKLLKEQEQSKGDEDNLMFVIRIESFTQSEEEITLPNPQVKVHVIDSGCKLVEALNGLTILEWPKIEVWTTVEWTAQISSGRIKILPKTVRTSNFQRPVDSGWPNKRIRLDTDGSARVPQHNLLSVAQTQSISATEDALEDQDPYVEAPSDQDSPPKSTFMMESLVQYSSSEDESN